MSYEIRPATLADEDVLVRHRIAMFTDMRAPIDAPAVDRAYRAWLRDMMPAGTYRAWLVDDPRDGIIAGGGITVLPWPPGPYYTGGRLAFVYNVYTEPAHRRRGLARHVMDTIHLWCRDAGIAIVALNASADARPLYEAMGYQASPAPMMFFAVVGV